MPKGVYIRTKEMKTGKGNLGRKRNEKVKKSMSEAAKLSWKKNPLRNLNPARYWLGKHRDEKTLKILRTNGLGKHPTIITRRKLSEAQKGDKCWNWKGGIELENNKIRHSVDFKLWREAVFRRDKYLCRMPNCDKLERYLHSHHIKKFSDFPELRFVVSNGITLCKKCHNKTQGREEEFESLFIEIIKVCRVFNY